MQILSERIIRQSGQPRRLKFLQAKQKFWPSCNNALNFICKTSSTHPKKMKNTMTYNGKKSKKRSNEQKLNSKSLHQKKLLKMD